MSRRMEPPRHLGAEAVSGHEHACAACLPGPCHANCDVCPNCAAEKHEEQVNGKTLETTMTKQESVVAGAEHLVGEREAVDGGPLLSEFLTYAAIAERMRSGGFDPDDPQLGDVVWAVRKQARAWQAASRPSPSGAAPWRCGSCGSSSLDPADHAECAAPSGEQTPAPDYSVVQSTDGLGNTHTITAPRAAPHTPVEPVAWIDDAGLAQLQQFGTAVVTRHRGPTFTHPLCQAAATAPATPQAAAPQPQGKP